MKVHLCTYVIYSYVVYSHQKASFTVGVKFGMNREHVTCIKDTDQISMEQEICSEIWKSELSDSLSTVIKFSFTT